MTDGREPVLPPLYTATRLDSSSDPPHLVLLRQAAEVQEGTLLWSAARGRLALALLLESEGSFEESAPVAIAAAVAIGDAIGALAPPVVAITNAWPDRVEVNGGLVGGVCLQSLEPEAAGRLILQVEVLISTATEYEPGERPDLTSLAEEGCGEITAVLLLESFSRHFLSCLHRWQEDGFAPLRLTWLARGPRPGVVIDVNIDDNTIRGRFKDLDSVGGLILDSDGVERRLSLVEALAAGPSWSLP
jgi:BirA family transcriptional regulator, biotin operon repressor / biotin---[acetyl-CoA-carboxylase] ligase